MKVCVVTPIAQSIDSFVTERLARRIPSALKLFEKLVHFREWDCQEQTGDIGYVRLV